MTQVTKNTYNNWIDTNYTIVNNIIEVRFSFSINSQYIINSSSC